MIRTLKGKSPSVHPSAFVSESAYVIGEVIIGPFSSVWPGAVIRADNGSITIGFNTNIQDNSVVHADANALIGNNVTIGHQVVCHASVVGNNVLLGNGSVINDGACIGSNSIVAAGSVVKEQASFPDGSMIVGIPATRKGRLLRRHHALIAAAADNYSKRISDYKT